MATVTKFANAHTAITTGYTDPTHAFADDTNYATAAPASKNSEVSAYYGFPAFTTSDIPDNSTINSVTVELLFKVSTTASVATQHIQVFVNTSGVGSEQSNNSEPLTDTVLSHQVTSGVTLANLRTADVVRARLRSARGNDNDAVTFSIDYVKCTVDFQTAPTIALNSPADAASISDTTPTLEFTGTDANSDDLRYNVQIATDSGFTAESEQTDDSIQGTSTNGAQLNATTHRVGQVYVSGGGTLTKAVFELGKVGSPIGNAVAEVYAVSGTPGTDAVPTGSALATSDTFDVSTLSGTGAQKTFVFSGANQIILDAETAYAVVCTYAGGDGSNFVIVFGDTGVHDGNRVSYSGTWNASSTLDAYFSVLVQVPGSVLLDKTSGTDSGFANTVTGGDTDPFNSGEKVSFTVQAGDELTPGTYYWRARVIDPSGSNTYSDWSTTRSFTISGAGGTLTADLGSFTLTGQTTGLLVGRLLPAVLATFTLTYQAAILIKGFLLTAAQSTVTLTGQAATFALTRVLAAVQATFTLSGQATSIIAQRLLTAAQASFTLTGFASALSRGLALLASQVTFTFTGQATTFTATRLMAAVQASFALTGQAVEFLKGLTMTTVVGTFTLTGQTALFVRTLIFHAAQGTFALTGNATGLLRGFLLAATQATFSITGIAATFARTFMLTAAQAVFALTGQSSALLKSHLLTAAQATFTLTGVAADFVRTYVLTAAQAAYTLTGNVAGLLKGYLLTAAQATYTFTGIAAELLYSALTHYILEAAQATFTLTGQAAGLLKGFLLTAATVGFTLTGIAVDLIHTIATTAKNYYSGGISAAKRMMRGMGF